MADFTIPDLPDQPTVPPPLGTYWETGGGEGSRRLPVEAGSVPFHPPIDGGAVYAESVREFAENVDSTLADMWAQNWQSETQVKAIADARALSRAAAPCFVSDGATSNRGLIQTPGARGNLAGAPVASWVGWVDVPALGQGGVIFALSNTTTLAGVTWRIECQFTTTGALIILQNGALSGTDQRRREYAGFSAFAGAGNRGWLEVRFTKGTAAPLVRWNGINITANFIDINIGAFPEWLPDSLVSSVHITGFNWPACAAPLGCWLNAHLTDTESETWRITGRPPVWVFAGGSQVLLINSDFSAGTSGFTATNGAVVGNVDAIAGVNDVLELNTAGGTSAAAEVLFNDGPSTMRTGERGWLKVDVYRPSTNTAGVWVGVRATGASLTDVALSPPADTWTTYSLPVTFSNSGSVGLQFRLSTGPSSGGTLGAGDKVYFKNVRFNRVGALSLLRPQVIPHADDYTIIGGNGARLVGMQGITSDPFWRIVARTTVNGNEQLLGGSLFNEPERQRIESWVVNNTGAATRTVSLGQSAGANTYANAVSCPVGRTEIALSTRFPATAQPALWAASNGTDTLIHTITGHRVGS